MLGDETYGTIIPGGSPAVVSPQYPLIKTKELLPPNLRGDLSIEGLCAAADRVFAIEGELDRLLVYIIDNVPDSSLPFLGWQFHCEGFDLARTAFDKRTLIKNSAILHRYKGTPWAVEQAVSMVGFPARVIEWFQYGGDPYYFKVEVDISERGMDEDLIALVEKLIGEFKNRRSWLEALRLLLPVQGVVNMACGVVCGEVITVLPYLERTVEVASTTPRFIAGFAPIVETITIYPQSS